MTHQKTVGLTQPQQIEAYENAKRAVRTELGTDVTEGEVIEELAAAYTGYNPAE